MSIHRLSDKERAILAAAHLNAELSIQALAEAAGQRSHTVQYCLAVLHERGLIRRRPMIDVHLLRLTQYSLFFSAHFGSTRAKTNLRRHLSESPVTSDVFELAGDFQHGVVLTVDDIQMVSSFLKSLAELQAVELVGKSLSTRISTSLLHRMYLGAPPKQGKHYISYRRTEAVAQLDEIDRRIIIGMYQNPDYSGRGLAQILGLPAATLNYRVKRLEHEKIIIGYVYGINSQALGMQTFRLLVSTRGFQKVSWQELLKFSLHRAQILCFIECIGAWDYEFEVEVKSAQEVAAVAQEIHEFFRGEVISIKTLPLLTFPKSAGYPYPLKFNEEQAGVFIQ